MGVFGVGWFQLRVFYTTKKSPETGGIADLIDEELSNSPRLLMIHQSNKTKWLHNFEKKTHVWCIFFLKAKKLMVFSFRVILRSFLASSGKLQSFLGSFTDPWKRCQRSTRRSSWRTPKYPRKPRFFAATFWHGRLTVDVASTTTIKKRNWRCRVGWNFRGVVGKSVSNNYLYSLHNNYHIPTPLRRYDGTLSKKLDHEFTPTSERSPWDTALPRGYTTPAAKT